MKKLLCKILAAIAIAVLLGGCAAGSGSKGCGYPAPYSC